MEELLDFVCVRGQKLSLSSKLRRRIGGFTGEQYWLFTVTSSIFFPFYITCGAVIALCVYMVWRGYLKTALREIPRAKPVSYTHLVSKLQVAFFADGVDKFVGELFAG